MRPRSNPTTLFTLALAVCTLAGCATGYREPSDAPPGTVAFVHANAPVFIARIDGLTVSRSGFSGKKRFALLPGPHKIEVLYSDMERVELETWRGRHFFAYARAFSEGAATLTLNAQAGRHYFVHDGRNGWANFWRPDITGSNEPVFQDLPVR